MFERIHGLSELSSLAIIARHFSSGVVIAPASMLDSLFADTLRFFLKMENKDADVLLFPAFERGYEGVREDPDIYFDRIRFQMALHERKLNRFVCISLEALSQKSATPQSLRKKILEVKVNEFLDKDTFISDLKGRGYWQDDLAEDPGAFSVRGNLVDVFSPYHEHPYRIEFFGDEVLSLRSFNIDSQRSVQEETSVELWPCREWLLSPKTIEAARPKLKELGDHRKIVAEERLRLIDQLSSYRDTVESRWLLPLFEENIETISTSFLKEWPTIFIDPDDALKEAERAWQRESLDFNDLPRLACGPDLTRWMPQPFIDSFINKSVPILDTKVTGQGLTYDVTSYDLLRPRLLKAKNYGPLIDLCSELLDQEVEVHVCIERNRRVEIVREALGPLVSRIKFDHAPPFRSFYCKQIKKAFITERDLFGIQRKRQESTKASEVTARDYMRQFSDLNEGDFIIHEQHGVAKFKGLKSLTFGAATSEFLVLEYADEDKLYVPIYHMDKVSRFLSENASAPRLDKLGTSQFLKKKSRAKSDILKVAHELLEIAAERKLKSVERVKIDRSIYDSFCHDFPYELTPDQETTILDIEKDISSSLPMDRLVCGDVGFGKTEVALRAAMLCVLQGKQVAVLAPTTLLVEQHAKTFFHRFQPFPVKVKSLSRFNSAKQQKDALDEVRSGSANIVIGTHRLLQKDVAFKDLGLLIVDEEQRFGVQHKEKIKKLRASADILTLSATPIPRTLQQSILGIRELSLIVTPPQNREAVRTFVGAYDAKLIQQACERERARGGQIFFVHNRVKSIDKVGEQIKKWLPDFKLIIAHGQMNEVELEKQMKAFIDQKADILLATSIIENGIDLPNANTLFVDHAEQFGLSDLYQLRGRVGRSNRSAYAYFLIHENTPLTEEASKRLNVVRTCTELGSGFKVATHDLEIRGAGNLLGEEQSGIISEIGFELYNELLEETLVELKSGQAKTSLTELNTGYSAYLPTLYIPDAAIRISTYRKLNRLSNLSDLLDSQDELTDRFGALPFVSQVLFGLLQFRIMATGLHAISMDCFPGKLLLQFSSNANLNPQKLLSLLSKEVTLDPKGRLAYTFTTAGAEEAGIKQDLSRCLEFLKKLEKLAEVPVHL